MLTQNRTVAPDRHMRAHLLVMGKYGSISYIISKQSMDIEVSHPLLYPEKTALNGQAPLITTEAEWGRLITAAQSQLFLCRRSSPSPILSSSGLLVKPCFSKNLFSATYPPEKQLCGKEGNSCLPVFPEMSVLFTQAPTHQNLFLTNLAFHVKCYPYPEYHGGPAQKQFPH